MHTSARKIILILCSLLTLIPALVEAVPEMMSYQGSVHVNGLPFTGAGRFSFAIVNASGVSWSAFYWSNDGNNPPVAEIEAPVTNGIYSILLGQSPQQPISTAVFDYEPLYLAVWFSDGVNGKQLLTPNQQLVSAGFSYKAARTLDAETLDSVDSEQFLRSDQNDTMNGSLVVTNNLGVGVTNPTQALDVTGSIKASISLISPVIKASANSTVPTIDFDSLANNAQGSGITIGKLKAASGQNNGQPYLWIRANGAHSWILDYTPAGTFWAQSIGAYYNDVKHGNIGLVGTGPTVDYLSIGFGGNYWWNNHSKLLIWKTGRIQFMPPRVGDGSGSMIEPTAYLVLAPGGSTTSSAPLKFRAGSLLTSPESGAMEWDGTSLFLTNSTLLRKTIAYTDSDITGTASNLTGTVTIAHGGTGLTSAVNGLLKGDGMSYSAAQADTDYLTPGTAASLYLKRDQTTPQTTTGTFTFPQLKVTALTNGRIPFAGAQGLLTDDSSLVWDNSNKRFGVGVTPAATFHISGPDINLVDRYTDVAGYGAAFALRRARGSFSAPAGVQANDLLGSINFRGYNGTGFSQTAAAIFGWAAEAWTSTSQGSYITFHLTAAGGTNLSERIRITDKGLVGVGISAPSARLHVVGQEDSVQTKIQGVLNQTNDLSQWLNVFGAVLTSIKANGVIRAAGYEAADGTAGMSGSVSVVTGITQDPVTKDISVTTKTITVKNGLITSIQ